MTQVFTHRPVLLEATVNALVQAGFESKSKSVHSEADSKNKVSGVFVDGTFGRGGHTRQLLQYLAEDARLFVFDKDPQAIEVANELAASDKRVTVIHAGFASVKEQLQDYGITQIDGMMMDLGISSPQIDDASRGFSFMREGPLDMRMDTSKGLTAEQWLATATPEEMTEVIKYYGEERFAFQISKAINTRRQSSPLRTTRDLAELVSATVRTREKGQHPATRTFQAIRIYLNEELQELSHAIASILDILANKGRLAVISFHSLEDRIVKQAIVAASSLPFEYAKLPLRESEMPKPVMQNLGRVLASDEEVAGNPRSRSAVLRIAERTDIILSDVFRNAVADVLNKRKKQ